MPDTPSARNPTWSRDELILTLDLYFCFKGKACRQSAKLSSLAFPSGLANLWLSSLASQVTLKFAQKPVVAFKICQVLYWVHDSIANAVCGLKPSHRFGLAGQRLRKRGLEGAPVLVYHRLQINKIGVMEWI